MNGFIACKEVQYPHEEVEQAKGGAGKILTIHDKIQGKGARCIFLFHTQISHINYMLSTGRNGQDQ